MDLLSALRSALRDDRRLYRLAPEDGAPSSLSNLLVEAWTEGETFNEPWQLELVALSPDANHDLDAWIGARVALVSRLADGSEHHRRALVLGAEFEEADGGLCRYRLTLGPWLALLGLSQHSQVWQDRPVTSIVEQLFAPYAPHAQWRWADCVRTHLAASPWSNRQGLRPMVVQHQQSDLALLQRLLREEGLALRFDRDTDTAVLLADSTRPESCPVLPDAPGGAVRFHRDDATEPGDTVQALGSVRTLPTFTLSALGHQHGQARSVVASVPSMADGWGPNAPRIEAHWHLGELCWGQADDGMGQPQLDRALGLAQAGWEVQHKRYVGRSTLRSLGVGRRFELMDSPLDAELSLRGGDPLHRTLLVNAAAHVGINNLPKGLSEHLAAVDGPQGVLPAWVGPGLRRQAARSGYANTFAAHRAAVPWHPAWWAMGALAGSMDEDAQGADELAPLLTAVHLPALTALHPKARHTGLRTASVVDAQGNAEPRDAAVHMDALGRIRVRLDEQGALPASGDNASASVWVRVAQAWAGPGIGTQFVPRLGQQVLLDFVNGDLEQPVVVGAVYDGRGEGALPATPGGDAGETDRSVFGLSSDHGPSAQGNLAGGHAPAWHGASPEGLDQAGQRNAAALSGLKSQEWAGGTGYSQLVLDDSDSQLRVQLATTAHGSQLNLGHLIHQADNHRGGFRGTGFELRTDAYASLRAGQGLLLSTAPSRAQEPAGDNAAGLALAKQLQQLATAFSQAAGTHRVPTLAAAQGSHKAGASAQSDNEAPAQALLTAMKGLVDGSALDGALSDAATRNTSGSTSHNKLPHTVSPVIAIQAQGGLLEVAGQDHVQAAGHTVLEATGQSLEQAVGGDWRLHTGQAIGVLGGVVKPGSGSAGTGLTAIAAQRDLQVQAQSDSLTLAAQKDVTVGSQSAHVDWAAAKSITLAVSGGASITIEAGRIEVKAPGAITVKAGKKSLVGSQAAQYKLPILPREVCLECLARRAAQRGGLVKRGA